MENFNAEHSFDDYGWKSKKVLFDCGRVTVTRAHNTKSNGDEYDTISVCYPINVIRDNNFLLYEGNVTGKAL